MPHSLFLGSGAVHPRLKEYDVKQGIVEPSTVQEEDNDGLCVYRPSIQAIRNCLKYSVLEVTLSLFTFALFVNSAILIVAGASLSDNNGASNADLFGIYDLLRKSIAPAAGTIFGLALLLSGLSAGIICTIAGQIVSEGMIRWTLRPWVRRMLTRSISIVPSIIIAGAVGRDGLNAALNASQVVLSVILPFASAPLIYFTCRNRYMTVTVSETSAFGNAESVKMRNGWPIAALAVAIWLVITVMNIALLVLVGLGVA
jgi:metal iron transporter